MNNLLFLFLVFSLNSCSMVYSPKAPSNGVSIDLCNNACILGKNSCTAQCSSTSKECLTACDAGFNSCNSGCNQNEDVIEKLKSKIKL